MLLSKSSELSNSYYYIILGLILKEIANIFLSIEVVYFGFSVISLSFVVFGFVIGRKSLRIFNGLQQFFFVILIILYTITILRGYLSSNIVQPWISTLGALNIQFANPKFLISYLIPLLVLNKWENFNFKTIEKIGFYVCLLSIFFSPFLIYFGLSSSFTDRQASDFGINLSVAGNFFVFLLFYKFIPKKHFIVYAIAWFLSLIILIVFARRGGVALNLLLMSFFFYTYYISKKGYKKILVIIVLSTFILGLVLFYESQNDFFSYLIERGFEDTRSGVNKAVLSQLSNFELFFGKGIYGRYYLPIAGDMFYDGWRYEVETGFYQMVLRGGFLMAVVYVITLLIPALNGLFFSKNTFCKASGLYIIWGLISLIPYGIPEFNIRFFIYWILAVLCYSKNIRYMNDAMIKQKFF